MEELDRMEELVTTIPVEMPRRPLTVADYAALPEDLDVRWELLEGNLVASPSPTMLHNFFSMRLATQLRDAAQPDHVAVTDVDLDLQLVPEADPATVRRPDVLVVTRAGFDRVRRDGGLLRAEDAVLVVEVLSPGSRRTDRIIKLGEYADAGIGHYWVVDLDDGPSLTAFTLVDGQYADATAAIETFHTDQPFALSVDLRELLVP